MKSQVLDSVWLWLDHEAKYKCYGESLKVSSDKEKDAAAILNKLLLGEEEVKVASKEYSCACTELFLLDRQVEKEWKAYPVYPDDSFWEFLDKHRLGQRYRKLQRFVEKYTGDTG